MSIKKFKKRPIVIEAIQYNNMNHDEISKFVGKQLIPNLESDSAYLAGKGTPSFSLTISTLEGDMKVRPSDWVIKGIKGEFYPCDDSIFKATYDEVN